MRVLPHTSRTACTTFQKQLHCLSRQQRVLNLTMNMVTDDSCCGCWFPAVWALPRNTIKQHIAFQNYQYDARSYDS